MTQNMSATLTKEAASLGLGLSELFSTAELPDYCWLETPKTTKGVIWVLAQIGSGFWRYVPQNSDLDNPVDQTALDLTEGLLSRVLPDVSKKCFFPADGCPLNLQALGRYLGWHTPSPMGLGIHPNFGLWTAFRAVWWLDLPSLTELAPLDHNVDVCLACDSQACVKACPASALQVGQMPNLNRCADYRFSESSMCVDTCVARLACPVGDEYQYSRNELAHYYDLEKSSMALFRTDPK